MSHVITADRSDVIQTVGSLIHVAGVVASRAYRQQLIVSAHISQFIGFFVKKCINQVMCLLLGPIEKSKM